MKIVVVNGKPTSGKSTFESLCIGLGHARCYVYSSIDYVKTVARSCGWNGEKTPENRKFLSDLKDLLTTWDDVPMKKIHEKIQSIQDTFTDSGDLADDVVVFIDVREPEEIQRLKDYYGATTLLITRVSADAEDASNHADDDVYNFGYDLIIENNGTLDDLRDSAVVFLDSLFKDEEHT